MTKKSKNPRIMLIRSPFALPYEVCPDWASIRSTLESITNNLQVNDAATLFLEHVALKNNDLETSAQPAAQAIHRLLSPDSSDPKALLADLATLDTALDRLTTSHSACRFHRSGFRHHGLNSVKGVLQFANDTATNPFRHFADQTWQPFEEMREPDLAMLYIDRPGQMGPATTLATTWRKRWPLIPLVLVSPTPVFGKESPPSERWPFDIITGMSQLHEQLQHTFDMAINITASPSLDEPNFTGGVPLIAGDMPAVIAAAMERNASLIAWRAEKKATDATFKQLYAASRQGLWNHVVLTDGCSPAIEHFVRANPNIVSSFCHEKRPPVAYGDPEHLFPTTPPAYGDTQPMPGVPLWMALKDVFSINKLLGHFNPKTLMRLRVKNDGTLFEVGKNLSYHHKQPTDLPEGYLEEVLQMVAAGGSVNTHFVRQNLENAYLITYVEEAGVIIGNSCLKRPGKEYIDAVSQQSGMDLRHYLERGYTSVRPEYRGLGVGAEILKQLTLRRGDHQIFSVIAENNIATQKMAVRNGSRRVVTFFSQRAKKEMSIWIPENMLPEGITLPEQPHLE